MAFGRRVKKNSRLADHFQKRRVFPAMPRRPAPPKKSLHPPRIPVCGTPSGAVLSKRESSAKMAPAGNPESKMAAVPKRVLETVMRLRPAQRAALASTLIESLDGHKVEEDTEAAWSKEIARRLNEIDQGKVRLIPWPEARRRLLARVHGRNRA